MLKEVEDGIWNRETGSGAQSHTHWASLLGVWLTQARCIAQQMGGSHLLPLGASPMQGVNQHGHMAHTALEFFIFHINNTTMV